MKNFKELIFDQSYINGQWVAGGTDKFKVRNPADGTLVSTVYDGDTLLVNDAIDSAHQALGAWKALSAKERSTIMYRWYELLIKNKEPLAILMTLECGKPLSESRGEVEYGASFIQWFAEEAKRANGDIIPGFTADRRVMVIKQPIGVVGVITPWNFPLAMITRKLGPALAVGCTVVVRPSEETPLSALAMVALADQAGFPGGVINVVVGTHAAETGKILCESPLVSKISFTGSTRVGQILSNQSVSTLKKLSLELGGNAPFIVFEDADIDAAVKGAVAGKFRFSGQTCVCVNRILIHEKIYDTFVERFVQVVSELKVGNGLDVGVNFGPLINKKAIERNEKFVADAISKGGKVLLGGKKQNEYFFLPTVIGDATADMEFAKEEIFGPIAPLFKFKTDEEAIQMANDTIYGLASYFYTKDLTRSWKVSEALEYGIVGINEGIISSESVPFGGVKYSGSGREGSHYGIDDYVELKYICVGNIK
ncbi:NAD-dependent succinate-semialdehyde dehydrogenase [Flavobacterium sp. NKUCC04_CG]|uniref:NAD-dependent succinate-semialdehyde dehydrogenase n=1 Tax=Flavobacterium sp. NKUCC04_CG TaxID=2842121 RepID=UPI001C5B4805|nr:NAD-dependent succinate-semialdehyde dehydrogenase [Flavobacterium sp. NKUCC04_CG]MBW3519149.1 NAD-dependent succinate-semialdehyde dehydrogenase [Flavobacterium sp. NKUCC04_CG]